MKKKKLVILKSGVLHRYADGSALVGRVMRGRQVTYILPPNTKESTPDQAKNRKNFGKATSAAYREMRDEKSRAIWDARWHDYLAFMEEQELPPKYTTLRGFITAEILNGPWDSPQSTGTLPSDLMCTDGACSVSP